MKSKTNIFLFVLIVAFIFGLFRFDSSFDEYSNLITFLSIMIGFEITSLATIFNSPITDLLYESQQGQTTELHALRDVYRFSIYFEIASIVLLFIVPNDIHCQSKYYDFHFGRYMLVMPILAGTVSSFIFLYNKLLKMFVYPTNKHPN